MFVTAWPPSRSAPRLNLGSDPPRERTWVVSKLGPVLATTGYTTTASARRAFTKHYLSGWAIVAGIPDFVTVPPQYLAFEVRRRSPRPLIWLMVLDS